MNRDNFIDDYESLQREVVRLTNENERLRKALERIANADVILYDTFARLVAKEALKQQG